MQFNWVFVLIAGAVILAAFFAFIVKQKAQSEEKIADTLIKDIETLITVAAAGKGAEPIQTPRTEVRFLCDEGCSCNIEVGRWTRGFRDKVIFSPDSLEGTSMLFWAMEWKVPFRVTNFLFLTNRNVKYFFIYSDDAFSKALYQKLRDIVPESIDYQFSKIDLFQERDDDYDKARFVFLGVDPGDLSTFLDPSFAKVDVSAVQIQLNQVTLYDKTSKSRLEFSPVEFPSFGQASQFAAMFAESPDNYRCNMQKAYKKLVNIAQLLQIRAEFLEQEMENSTLLCGYQAVYDSDGGLLQAYLDIARAGSLDLKDAGGFPFEALEQKNNDLLLEGCPLVY